MPNLTLKIESMEVRTSKKDEPYALAKGVMLLKDGTISKPRTIMSFGPQFASVRKFFRAGRKITVQAVFDGGTVKVLGPAKETKAKAKKAA